MQSGRGPGRRNQEEGRTRRGSNSDAANTAAKVAGPLAAGLRKQYHYSAAEALNPLQPMINGLSLIQKCLPLAISLYLFFFLSRRGSAIVVMSSWLYRQGICGAFRPCINMFNISSRVFICIAWPACFPGPASLRPLQCQLIWGRVGWGGGVGGMATVVL